MKTAWKVAVTIGVFALFLTVFGVIAFFLSEGLGTASLSGGNVMVIPVYGAITFGGCGGGLLTGALQCTQVPVFKKQLEAAEKDPSVKAVLLEINSGGGSVVASRELMRAVRDFEKPVVSWIGEVGASGAYYVASGSDHIMADRDSLTGSIGVIMEVPHYYELMDEVGVNVTVIKAGDSKDIGSPYRPMTEGEEDELQGIADKIYQDFVGDVALNRNLEYGYVENLSQGQIYLGSEAKNLGLIDENGGFDEALAKAASLGKIKGKPSVKKREERVGLLDILFQTP